MDAGFTQSGIRLAIRRGLVRRIRASWIAIDSAPPDMAAAAEAGGRLTCVSLARHRGWWVPQDSSSKAHVHLLPTASPPGADVVAHWSRPIGAHRPRLLLASVEDALMHAARCFPLDDALAIWESAARVEKLSVESLRRVRWRDSASRRCAEHLRPGTDSSLETIFRVRLSSWGLPIRVQVHLAGHHVDFLIGTHLIVQIDGWAFTPQSAIDRATSRTTPRCGCVGTRFCASPARR